jgi:hypothetical protein
MPVGKGFASRLGIALETNFGTAAKVSGLLPFTSESLTKEQERVESGALLGTAGKRQSYIVGGQVSGDISANLTYTDFDEIFEASFGSKTVDSTTGKKTFDLTEDINKSLTIAIEKGVSIHEFVGCKISKPSPPVMVKNK